MSRNWSAAHAKCLEEPRCRVCGARPVDPAHIVPRSRVTRGGEDALNIVPLCRSHHRAYDEGGFDLLPYLTREEQAYAVGLVGLTEALRRITNERAAA